MTNLIHKILQAPESIPLSELRYYKVIKVAALLALSNHAIWVLIFIINGISQLIIFNSFSVLLFSICLYLVNKRNYTAIIYLATSEAVIHQIYAAFLLGASLKFQYFLVLVAMMPFLVSVINNLSKIILLFACVGAFLFIDQVIGNNYVQIELSKVWSDYFIYSNTIMTLLFLGVIGLYFSTAAIESERIIVKEREKSDRLLLNILPASIANRLKNKESVIVDKFDSVSILFADIVGFTQLSERLSPEELIVHLNDIFSNFDKLAEQHGLEKIKTIGDAYMISAGIPEKDPNHAKKLALFALDIKQYMERRTQQSDEKLQIRIGIHSGPAVAGVIGIKKFSYDIWGDTVNVASRMESHGVPSRIHVSENFYAKTSKLFEYQKCDPIEIKGKGLMQTYFLIGIAANKT